MRRVKLSSILVFLGIFFVLAGGCNSKLKDLRIRNDMQRKEIADLRSQLEAARLELEQVKRQLADAQKTGSINEDALKQQIAALEEDIKNKTELIARLQEQILGGAQLPPELSTMLEDFAKAHDMVSFDESRGIVKFKSDLLFEKGSAKVASEAAEAVKSLCSILNSEQGQKFDIIIAGHTDDIPVLKAVTKARHPDNWYLSVHRAISVEKIMQDNNIDPKRMSVRGFGEYRPIAPNKPGHKGNPLNRRVEIYIVPEGM